MDRSKISVTTVFCALTILPSIYSQCLEDSPILPEWIDPMVNMLVSVKSWPAQSSINPYNRDSAKLPDGSIVLPSVYCLLLSTDHRKIPARCFDGVDRAGPGLQMFFEHLYDDLHKGYPTLYSFLFQESYNFTDDPFQTVPRRIVVEKFHEALELFGSYLMLPLMAKHGGFQDPVLFVAPANSESNVTVVFSKRSGKILRGCSFVVAMNNPILWHLPVNSTDPYSALIPNLRADDPYAIDMSIITSKYSDDWFREYIGSDWDPTSYKTRGLLFMGVLREFMQRSVSNTSVFRGYGAEFLSRYCIYVHRLAASITVPSSYVERGIVDPASSLGAELLDAPTYPPWIDLKKNILVKVNDWPEQSSIESYSPSSNDSQNGTILLPSIYCLELQPDLNLLPEICIDAIERHKSIIGKLWTERYAELTANENWRNWYPTLIGFLYATLAKTEITDLGQSVDLPDSVQEYSNALGLIGTYVIVPLIVHYREIDSAVVWLTCHKEKFGNCSIESTQSLETHHTSPTGKGRKFILPLSNPRLWHLPVNSSDPYSVIPKLLPDHPQSDSVEPLMSVLSNAWFIKNIHENWNPEKYKTRGLFLIGLLLELRNRILIKQFNKPGLVALRYTEALFRCARLIPVPPAYINVATPMKSGPSNPFVVAKN